jgi:hypothetical protein
MFNGQMTPKELKMTKTLANLLKPYRVTFVDADGFTATHRAWTPAEALEWAGCYGWGTSTITTRLGRFVASVAR